SRIFDVSLEENIVLDNFDILSEIPEATALVKTFDVEVTDGVLNLAGIPIKDQAKIAAIEVWMSDKIDNINPTVSISSPEENQTLEGGNVIIIKAEATDEDGEIAKVEFYINGGKIGEDDIYPFSLNWTPKSEGDYQISAKVFDNKGGTGESKSYDISIVNPTIPEDNSKITGFILINSQNDKEIKAILDNETINLGLVGKRLNLKLATENKFGSIVFYLNGKEYRKENVIPYALAGNNKEDYFNWNLGVGDYTVLAKAWSGKNGSGEIIEEKEISFSLVDEFVLTSPSNGEAFTTGHNITLSANVPESSNDRPGKMTVEFFVDGQKVGEDSEFPYELQWSTFTMGNHKIEARLVATTLEVLDITPEVIVDIEKLVNLLPSVKMLNLTNQTYKYGNVVSLEASASDLDGNVVKLQFYHGNHLLAELVDGVFNYDWKYPEPGYYSISAIAIDNDNESQMSETIELIVLNTDGTFPQKPIPVVDEKNPIAFYPELEEEILENLELEVTYGPNPVNSDLNVLINYPNKGQVNIIIKDLTGKVILNENYQKENTEFKYHRDLSQLIPGIYLVSIDLDGQDKLLKIIKK
ncbi:MAG: T9SS type A sorting domain-containing protein, partial [Flammeovirgaceae bacterium]|nr:T9SS type A sorting domain-containing protein [Flammeovirgaceae bacterium]